MPLRRWIGVLAVDQVAPGIAAVVMLAVGVLIVVVGLAATFNDNTNTRVATLLRAWRGSP